MSTLCFVWFILLSPHITHTKVHNGIMKMGDTRHVVKLQSGWDFNESINTITEKVLYAYFYKVISWNNFEYMQCSVCAGCVPRLCGAAPLLRDALTPAARSGRSPSPGCAGRRGWTRTAARMPSTLPLSVDPFCPVTSSTQCTAWNTQREKASTTSTSRACLHA